MIKPVLLLLCFLFIASSVCINSACATITQINLSQNITITNTDFGSSNNNTYADTIIYSDTQTPDLTFFITSNQQCTGAILSNIQNLTISGSNDAVLTLRPYINLSPYYYANTYTGTTTIESGVVLNINDSSCISDNSIILNGGTLQFAGDFLMTSNQNITLQADSTIDLNNCNPSFQYISINLGIYNLTVLNNSKVVKYNTVTVSVQGAIQTYDPITYPSRIITYYDFLGQNNTLMDMDGQFLTSNGVTFADSILFSSIAKPLSNPPVYPDLSLNAVAQNLTLNACIYSSINNLTIDGSSGHIISLRPTVNINPYYVNYYIGTTKINSGGTLNINDSSCISNNTIILNGGTLQFDGNFTLQNSQNISLNSDSTIDYNHHTPVINQISLNGYSLTILNNSLNAQYNGYELQGTITSTLLWQGDDGTFNTTYSQHQTNYNTDYLGNFMVPTGGSGQYVITIKNDQESIVTDSGGGNYTLTNGTLTISGSSFTYSPSTSFNGNDIFTYAVTDVLEFANNTLSDIVTITVSSPTIGATPIDIVFEYDAANPYNSANDAIYLSASEGTGTYTYTIETQPYGSVTINQDSSFTYTAFDEFATSDSFTYTATDTSNPAATSAPANVSITITHFSNFGPFPPPPGTVIASAPTFDVPYNQSKGSDLSIVSSDISTDSTYYNWTLTTDGTYGTASISQASCMYTPNSYFYGADSFQYTVTLWSDNMTNDTETVNVNVIGDLAGFNLTLTELDNQILGHNITNSTGSNTLTLNYTTGNQEWTGNITDNGDQSSSLALTLTGGREITLSGNNAFQGDIIIDDSTTLILTNTQALSTFHPTININNNAIIKSNTIGDVTFSNPLNFTGNKATLSSSTPTEFAGTLKGALVDGLTINGGSTTMLSGTQYDTNGLSTPTFPVTVSTIGSKLILSSSSLTSGSLTFNAGTTFQATGTKVISNQIFLA